MARSQATIKADMLAAKAADSNLTILDSLSALADWNLFMDIVVFCIWVHETFFDLFTAEVNTIAAAAKVGTGPWYEAQALAFQFGDIVQVLPDFSVGYAVVDPSKQIVAQAKITKVDGDLALKVWKATAPLTGDEQVGLAAYMNKKKFAGTDIVILSLNKDLLRITGNFYYDPEIAITDVHAAVDAAGASYLAAIDFNGYWYNSKFKDALEQALGYIDFQPLSIQASDASGGGYAEVARIYNPVSGLLAYENPLSTTLTFIPNV